MRLTKSPSTDQNYVYIVNRTRDFLCFHLHQLPFALPFLLSSLFLSPSLLASLSFPLPLTLVLLSLSSQAEISSEQGKRKESYRYFLFSILLNLGAVALAVVCVFLGLFIYVYIVCYAEFRAVSTGSGFSE